jgi:hypothetical protein
LPVKGLSQAKTREPRELRTPDLLLKEAEDDDDDYEDEND